MFQECASAEYTDSSFDTMETIMLIPNPPPLADDNLETKDKETLILSNSPLIKMEEILSLGDSSENVVCSSYEKFQEILTNFETDTYTKYIITKTKGAFADSDVPLLHRRVRWWENGSLKGVPYIIAATRYFSCRYGAPTHSKILKKYAQEREKKQKLGLCKRYKNVQGSKKYGCPVKFVSHRLLIFPDFQVGPAWSKEEKEEIKNGIHSNFKAFRYETRYTCVLPDVESHEYHYRGPSSASTEPIDARVLDKIKTLVSVGKTDPDDVMELVEDFVTDELKVQDKDRRRFFPSRVDVMHAVNRAKLKIRNDDNEQEKIKALEKSWGNSNEVYLRSSKLVIDKDSRKEDPEYSSKFLFVYQSHEMKRLYRLYGRNSVFIDAVHRTLEYVWPLYFIIVNTNVNYQVVGFFITQIECKTLISEAFEIINSWNPFVSPKYGFVNRPWEELKALEMTFPDVKTFISTYHRNLAWEKKVKRRENNGLNRSEILSRLEAVANSETEKEIRTAIYQLKKCEAYNSSSVKHYYESSWHLQLKRWTSANKPCDLYFELNDGFRRLKDDIKYDYLSQFKQKSLSFIINMLIKNYIPSNLIFYWKENLRMLSKHKFHAGIPTYLRICSEWVLDKIFISHLVASEESEKHCIHYVSKNEFKVSSVEGTSHEVNFQPSSKLVLCNCSTFKKTKVICKHALIIGTKYPEWHLSKISSWLFDNPIYKLDSGISCTDSPSVDHHISSLENSVCQSSPMNVRPKDISPENKLKCSSVGRLNHIRTQCKLELESLQSLIMHLKEDRLKNFLSDLRNIRAENAQDFIVPKNTSIKAEVGNDWGLNSSIESVEMITDEDLVC